MSDFHFDPFHNDAFSDGGGVRQQHDGRRLENFMQRKQQKQDQRQRHHRPMAQQGRGHMNDESGPLLSPSGKSEDGMSYVSRMKHNNYANVVMEMKKMQGGQPLDPQRSQSQHQPQSHEWELDAKFGDGDGLIGGRQQQPPRQSQHYPGQQQRQQQPDGYTYSHQQPRQYEMQPRPPPTRAGRTLYKDPEDSHVNRSRSTVRRIADRTVKLSQTLASSSGDAGDDCGSVISFSCQSTGGEGYAGFPMQQQQQQQRQQDQQRRSSSSKLLARSLDSFVANHSGRDDHGDYNNDDNCSVVSGSGSVAARRRAARHQQMMGGGHQSPQQPQPPHGGDRGNGHVYRSGSNFHNNVGGSMPPLHQSSTSMSVPPGATISSSSTGNAAGSARNRMRMRMHASSSSSTTTHAVLPGNNNPSGATSVPSSSSSSPSSPWQKQSQHPHKNGRSPPRKPILLTPITDVSVDREVNMALSELKLSHSDIIDADFISEAFGRMDSGSGSTASPHESFDSSASLNNVGGGSPLLKNVIRPSPAGNAAGGANKIPASGGGGGVGGRTSPHTVSTRSMTITNSSTIVDHPATRPAANVATTIGAVGGESISPMISVDHHSESSSLTDEMGSDSWQLINSNNNRNGINGGNNIFKDAERMGSTFHKSKKIVRPEDSVTVASSFGGGPTAVASTILSARPSLQVLVNNGTNSTSRHHDPATTLPPAIEKTASDGGNPFAVKLRKTNQLPQTPTSSNVSSSTSVEKKIMNSTIVGSTKTTATTVATSGINVSGLNMSRPGYGEEIAVGNNNVNHDEETPKNPFLAQIKLRKTNGAHVNSGESVQLKDSQVGAAGTTEEAQPQENRDITKKKLTYREQQELLRQERQELENKADKAEEPIRDVATMIRERIAASKSNSLNRLNCGSGGELKSSSSTNQSNDNISSWRGKLKNASDSASPSTISSSAIQSYKKTNNIEGTTVIPTTRQTAAIAPVNNEEEDTLTTVKSSSSECEENVDPRAALMAMLKRREDPDHAAAPVVRRAPISTLDNDDEQHPPPDPRNALLTMLAKRGDLNLPSPTHVLSENKSPLKHDNTVSAIISQRAPQQSLQIINTSHHTGTNANGNGGSGSAGRPAIKNDPKYEKYFKMLKMGMPLPVVQHAMTRDGFDPSVMDGDHNMPAPLPKPQDGVPLKDDPAYAKYFKMIKLGLPIGAVKNAMERDGVDSSVMDGDHNAPVSLARCNKSSSSIDRKQKDTHRRTRLHWDALEDTEVNSDSVWALVEEDVELNQIEIDEKEFTTLFQAEITSNLASGGVSGSATGSGGGGGSSRNVVQVIDPKRANNGGIILARLRMSYDDMARAVDAIDETAMQANQAQGIIEYMPSLNERKSLREYMKTSNKADTAANFDRLCECEKFMVAMMTVKQSKRKIRALLFKLQFRGCIHDLAHDVFSIEKACDEISSSVRLRKLFGIVLNIGNRLNTAGPGQKRKAGAFSIKSLLKLNQAKAFDNKTTFLHYVVLVVQRNSEALLDFKDDLPTVFKADKIYWDQCVSELEEVETQLENVRKLALYEAKSNKVKYQLPKTKSSEADNDSDEISVDSMSLEDEVSLLRSTKTGMFALSAIRKVSQLRERVDMAKDKFTSLLKYLGESSDSKMQPHELFEIITTFCRTFHVARVDVEKMEKAKKRDEKKEKDSEPGTKNERLKAIQEVPATNKTPRFPRASSHQPNMSSVITDIKRATTSIYSSPVASLSTAQLGQDVGPPKITQPNMSSVITDIKRATASIYSSPVASLSTAQLGQDVGPPEITQPNMSSVITDIKRATTSIYSSPVASLSTAQLGRDVGPPKVTYRYPDDESSPVHVDIQRKSSHRYSPSSIHETQAEFKGAQEKAVHPRAQHDVSKITKSEDELIAIDADAADLDQRIPQAGTIPQETDKLEMLHRAEEAAEAARLSCQAKRTVAAEKAAQLAKRQLSEEAATSNHSARIPMQQAGQVEKEKEPDEPEPQTRKQTLLTRREILSSRRLSARNRIPSQTTPIKEPSSVVASAPLPAETLTTQPIVATKEQSTPPREDSKANSTLARDRYARHKRLLQQRGR